MSRHELAAALREAVRRGDLAAIDDLLEQVDALAPLPDAEPSRPEPESVDGRNPGRAAPQDRAGRGTTCRGSCAGNGRASQTARDRAGRG